MPELRIPDLKRIVMAAGMFGIAPSAKATSPDAWNELYAKATAACVKAAPLAGASVRPEIGIFDAAVLLTVDGRHPNGMRGTAYCLYDKTTAKTETTSSTRIDAAAKPKTTPAKAPVRMGRTCWTESFGAQLKTPRPIGTSCTAKNDEGDDYRGVVRP